MQQEFPTPNNTGGRIVGAVGGLAFCGMGLTVLGFLWLSPFGTWNSLPIFFRIFGSFIAITFVVVGGTAAAGTISGKTIGRPRTFQAPSFASGISTPGISAPQVGYHCPQCAAPLSDKADVSPLGDVKCTFCSAWFNIHQSKS